MVRNFADNHILYLALIAQKLDRDIYYRDNTAIPNVHTADMSGVNKITRQNLTRGVVLKGKK